ncbi:6-bladed beta-propeller [Flavivirga aquimarina]|uniref:6-bladed beta-propeller n=1 Tax=Flavivirga aquimarina TaxID=2027862 RepID=A0ABT8WCG5_9FLAO|nr:6-bladed beta-propeller [Flavivirga aquimarina]MDO5970762.1 6-bladed beta-propeller [Flavivirga aquimarina]
MRLLLLLLCFSCKDNNENIISYVEIQDGVTRISVDSLREYSSLKFSDIFDNVEYIKLETKEEFLVGEVYELDYFQENFYVLDKIKSKSILVFDKEGNYKKRLGQNGNGPEEYVFPQTLEIDQFNKELLVYDSDGKSIIKYDYNGKYKSHINFDYYIRTFSVLEKDLYALYFNHKKNYKEKMGLEYDLMLMNSEGEIVDKLFPFKKEKPSASHSFFSHSKDNQTLFSPSYDDVIYNYTNNSFKQKYFIDFGKYRIPQSIEIDFNNKIPDAYTFVQTFIETPKIIFFKFSYKGKRNYGFYSKKTKTLIYANLLINDIKGLLTFDDIITNVNDNLIGVLYPQNIIGIKNIYLESGTDNVKLNKTLEKSLKGAPKEMKNEYRAILESTDFKVTKEDLNFVDSITPFDNPILVKLKIKDF